MPNSSINHKQHKQHRIRSFVRRNARLTAAQARAYEALWPRFGLTVAAGNIDNQPIFGRTAPCFLEIGFGTGQSLLALAAAHPELNLIGVDTHKPGIGAVLLGMQQQDLSNIRLYDADVIDVLEQCIPPDSFEGIQIFFPDPWPKRRHYPRRLIQASYVQLMITKLKMNGSLHLATDWEDYAKQMLQVLSQETALKNVAGPHQFAPTRSVYRPVITKFEARGIKEKRKIWELQFVKV